MKKNVKEFLKFAIVPICFLVVYLVLVIVYSSLHLPSADEIIQIAQMYYERYGYLVVFLGAVGEGLLFVNWYFPGSIIVVLGVILAQKGTINIFAVLGLTIGGFFLTSLLNYALGRYGLYKVFLRFGLYQPLEKIKQRVEQFGLRIIFSTYINPSIGALTATSAGILRVPFLPFSFYSLASLIFWNTFWSIIIYFAGPYFFELFDVKTTALLFIGWIIYLGIKFVRQKNTTAESHIP